MVDRYRRFVETYVAFYPDEASSKFLRNVGYVITKLQGATTNKTVILIYNIVRTSNLVFVF